MEAAIVLQALADNAKRDPTFEPIKNKATTRWHSTAQGLEFELLLTGPKSFDTRAEKGGGGSIDLAIHPFGLDFKTAIGALRKWGL